MKFSSLRYRYLANNSAKYGTVQVWLIRFRTYRNYVLYRTACLLFNFLQRIFFLSEDNKIESSKFSGPSMVAFIFITGPRVNDIQSLEMLALMIFSLLASIYYFYTTFAEHQSIHPYRDRSGIFLNFF